MSIKNQADNIFNLNGDYDDTNGDNTKVVQKVRVLGSYICYA